MAKATKSSVEKKVSPIKPAAKPSVAKKPSKATVTVEGLAPFDLPILHGSEGPSVIDVSSLYKQSGMFTFDPGFFSTASCESKITFIDGDQGILRHRGYDIADLADKGDYYEVCYLLLYGELPNTKQKEKFVHEVTMHTMVHEQLQFLYRGFPRRSHPMAILVGAVASLSAFYHDETDVLDPAARDMAAIRLITKMPTMTAMAYKYSIGQPFIYPKNKYSLSENFLNMMFSVPAEDYKVNKVLAKAIDKLLILHADHEQNASTSTVRLSSSSQANPYACIGAGISCLWGPAHGGANEAVIKMLDEIGDVKRIPEFIKRAKDKDDPFRLMGFGHRVYKNYDPRARLIKKIADEVLDEVGAKNSPMLKIAMELEKIALSDDYFVQRKLYPNVDFYSGIIYKAIGIPTQLFTGMFAMARTVGWMAQWREMFEDPQQQKIGRPRQLYTGAASRTYVPLNKRK